MRNTTVPLLNNRTGNVTYNSGRGHSLKQAAAGNQGARMEKVLPCLLFAGAALTLHILLMTPEICFLVIPHAAPAAQRQTAAAARANSLLRRRGRSFDGLSF